MQVTSLPLVLALVALLSGCSALADTPRESQIPAYDGTLGVVASTHDLPEPIDRGGAAAQALECDGRIVGGGSGNEIYEGSGGGQKSSAVAALTEVARDNQINFWGPPDGYVVERDDGPLVLFSLDDQGLSKVTAVAHESAPRRWDIISWASCDPYEWPDESALATDEEVWLDKDGERVPTYVVSSGHGSEHCDWDRVWFVGFEWDGERITTSRDPRGDFGGGGFLADITLPGDAVDTGYHFDGFRLWLSADKRYVYAVVHSTVERWQTHDEVMCR